MSPEPAYRSSTSRLTLSYSVIVFLLVIMLQGAVFVVTRDALESEVGRLVDAELVALNNDWKAGGMRQLINSLNLRSQSWGRTGAVYLLTDPFRNKVAGNLSAWPRDITPRDGEVVRFRISAEGDLATHPVTAQIVQVKGDGSWLLVGTDTSETERALRRFGWATVWGIGAITLLIALLGRWNVARTARRVRAFSATCDSIVHSDLSRRLKVGSKGDEYDQLGRTVNAMLERLEQQAVLLRTTFGSIAHDLRTPLYRLRVRLDEALLRAGDPESRELVAPALEELDRVQRTLGTLLEIARAEGGGTVAGSEPVDLTQLVQEMFELYQPGMQDKELVLTLDAAPGITMMGKRQLLAQLIANLLENAMKYVPAGGKVVMSLQADVKQIVLAVADNGPGVPVGDRERAQEPFVTLQNGTDKPSSGLGLSLVKAIVRLHRGELVLADNAPGLRVECRFGREPG
jgi:signal transduction histidine kinase